MADEKFDGLFLTLAQQSQGIEPLLDNLFSFLRRKSDFFNGVTSEKTEEVVLKYLRKHSLLAEKDLLEKKLLKEKEEKKKKEKEEQLKKQKLENSKKTEAIDDEVIELSDDGSFDISKPSKISTTPVIKEVTKPVETKEPTKDGEEDEDKTPPPPGNGGRTEKYVWTQTLSEVVMNIPLPNGVNKKTLSVDIKNSHLKVLIKGNQEPLIDGDFHKRIVVDDSLWTIEDGELIITLQKDNRMEWWKSVIIGDPEINTQKVQPENSHLSDLDAETRQTVEKMMFDQKQKALGLPSSEELQKQEMLKKFMAAHPEMDFSNAKFS
eukprot:gene19253-25107_t